MICPYCEQEMTVGLVKGEIAHGFGASMLYWYDDSVDPSLLHPAGEPLISDFGNTHKRYFEHPAIKAYKCACCKIVLMEAYTKNR